MPKNKSHLGSESVLSSGSMVAAHSGVYSTFCMSLRCIPSADGDGSQPAVTLINGTIKFTASVYFILLMRVLFSKYSFFKRYSNSAVLFYCCVDMGEVVICTSCFLSLVRMLEEQSCLDWALPQWVGTVLCKAQMAQLWTMCCVPLYCDSTDGGESRCRIVVWDSNAASKFHKLCRTAHE